MGITWKYVKGLNTADAVEAFLGKKGITLPKETVLCLETNNGGRPSSKEFNVEKGSSYVFNSLFSYNDCDVNYIGDFLSNEMTSLGLYPIALEAGGDVVCYNMHSKKFVLLVQDTGEYVSVDYGSNKELFAALGA